MNQDAETLEAIAVDLQTEARLLQKLRVSLRADLHSAGAAAIACDELLLRAKATLPRGQFIRWLNESCVDISRKDAMRYLRLAARYHGGAEAQSLRAAIEALNVLPTTKANRAPRCHQDET